MYGLALIVAALILDATLAASPCAGNSATTRSQWCDNFDVTTNYYDEVPDTGVTRTYYLEVQNITAAPDGIARQVQVVNGSLPGPTIEADWGDTVAVHVKNGVSHNGTGIHFHGIRQLNTNDMDGVPSITQCPIAPSRSLTYTWRATQYGTSWYHSHFGRQAWDGVFGGIVIHGPATANYDEEIGLVFLNDWYHKPVDTLYSGAQTKGPPALDTGLINGKNVYSSSGTGKVVGARFETTVESGKSYLIRLVNGAIDTHFTFSIDSHTILVIATDFVPVTPYQTRSLSIGIGQRYDIVVSADQANVASDFWMRAVPEVLCSDNANGNDIRGILHYGSSTQTPSTTAYETTSINCAGEPLASIVPKVPIRVPSASFSSQSDMFLGKDSNGVFKWHLNDTSFRMDWGSPTALQIVNGDADISPSNGSNIVKVDQEGDWVYFIFESDTVTAHPMHLHGHDMFVLGSGFGAYDPSTGPFIFNTVNPARRDTTMLPRNGWLVAALKADNPGAWLLHSQIGWAMEEGLAMQVLDQPDKIAALYGKKRLQKTCRQWNAYQRRAGLTQDNSGI